MSDYLIVPLLWILLLVAELYPRVSLWFALGLVLISILIWLVPLWLSLVFFGAYIGLWRLYRWRINTTHALFMAAYVSLFTGIWLFAHEQSPRTAWVIWFLGVSGVALFIASRVVRRYNGKIIGSS